MEANFSKLAACFVYDRLNWGCMLKRQAFNPPCTIWGFFFFFWSVFEKKRLTEQNETTINLPDI